MQLPSLFSYFSLFVSFIASAISPFCASGQSGFAKPLAFPGAEGFGKYTSGGRGGQVLVVRNLDDSGPGSFREAVTTRGPRIVVFAVSGTIALKSKILIRQNKLTIAGQSAPGDGICLKNYNLTIEANDVIIRYLRFRLGDEAKQQDDAITGLRQKRIIIDHCSMSWATDECASFYDNENFTMQWCLIAESLNKSIHEKGAHGYGGIWGGMGASFHHNLIAHQNSRTPRFCGSRYHKQPQRELVDFRNNVIYNWGINDVYGGEKGNHNLVSNYYKPGPATPPKLQSRIVNPSKPYGQFFVAENFVMGDSIVSKNNLSGGVQCDEPDSAIATEPFMVETLPEQTAQQAYEQVLAKAGASYRRDAIDARVVNDVRTGTASFGSQKRGIIDSQKDVGGWVDLKQAPAPVDTDADGMPDQWENSHDLDPNNPADASQFKLDDQYTNVEVYLNSLVL
ncbi:pectate lyase family protein [Spirosoma foliorum]|uniref:pectate lyase family protein n=1 Tax=Spirosoma foliorum TaxID=2710596 RepID=UPI001F0AF0F6|nr:pectate lyase [Spirosoma foliorum]